MDPATFQMLMASAAVGLQIAESLISRTDLTPEQKAEVEALKSRVRIAQLSVTAYVKEPEK